MKKNDIKAFINYIEDDLPQLAVSWGENLYSGAYDFSIYDKITSIRQGFTIDKRLFEDDINYAKSFYESARREILMERGKQYARKYSSPGSLASGVTTTEIKAEDILPKYYSTTSAPPTWTTTTTSPGSGSGYGVSPGSYTFDPKTAEELMRKYYSEPIKAEVAKPSMEDYEENEDFGLF